MTTDVYTGKAYTTAARPESVRSRASRGKWWLIGIGLVVALAVLVAVTSKPTDYRELSIGNSTDNGARAVAQILGDQGVTVRQFDALARVFVADPATTTLVLANADYMTDAQIDSVLDYEGDILFIGASEYMVQSLDAGLDVAYDFLPENVAAECNDPDAVAAEESRLEWTGIVAIGATSAELCFGGRSDAHGMAVVETAQGTRTVIANWVVFENGQLENLGNAALALRTAGHHENVAWYLSDGFDTSVLGTPGEPIEFEAMPDFLPPGFGTALYALGLAALVAALWKGRRFGPLAVEPLPIAVRASEATRGRARLYRRARAYGRATAALRAAAARRMGGRLGVPRATSREGMVSAIERATGQPATEIAKILYGPPPTSEAEMISIVDQLDALEGKVHGQ
jgi:hypothetical protein